MPNINVKSDLLDKYLSSLIEYFNAMNASEVVQEMEKKDFVIDCGLQSITHIFKLTYLSTRNSDIALCYSQKGMYCYLEYIEQIIKTNAFIHLNNMDAIVFEYSRTLMEIYNSKAAAGGGMEGATTISSLANDGGDRESPSNTHLAMFFASDENIKQDMLLEIRVLLENLAKWIRILLWKNKKTLDHSQTIKCISDYFKKYAILFTENSVYLLDLLETIQLKMNLSFEEYLGVLDEFYLQWKKVNKQKKVLTREDLNSRCLEIIVDYSGKTLGEIREESGEKHVYDFLKL